MERRQKSFNKPLRRLERWFESYEHLLLFPAHISGGSQPAPTPVPGDKHPFWILSAAAHTCPYPHIHINKLNLLKCTILLIENSRKGYLKKGREPESEKSVIG